MGVKSKTIHSLSQALGTGVVFLELQLKEYTAAFFTFRDSIFGSDFYGTTCLHGLHVTTGSTSFGILWCSLNNNEGYKEVHQYQKFWGYYWHLVDSIWISLFMLFYLRIIFKAIYSEIIRINTGGQPLMGTTPPRVSKGTILKHPLFDFDNSSIYYRNSF